MKFQIVSDSSCDLPKERVRNWELILFRFMFLLKKKTI